MNKLKRIMASFLVLCLLIMVGCSDSKKESNKTIKITVSAASSMTESLNKLKDMFEKEHPSITITYNFGGTGTLRKQVEQGAPVDLFFLASKKDYQLLEKGGYIQKGNPIFENQLVIIKQEGTGIDSFKSFLNTNEKVAIGTPEAVPAGTYSKQMLKSIGAWDKLVKDNRLVFAKDVHHVLNLVETGAVDIGFVYLSDTLQATNIEIMKEIDSNLHEPIKYYMAMMKEQETNQKAVETFYQYVLLDKGLEVFESYGFQTNKDEEKSEES
jgi:molybdate transport system substrate-binding protein